MNSLEKPILSWFKKNKRDLPWRNTSPWGVMVSEYMLQQTPVNRVLPKWNEWMEHWPTPKDLAAATPAQVITAWGRLGYPRRALRLHAAAQIIAEDLNNKVPEDQQTLLWAAATMELGALVCTSKNPACELCPIISQCQWRKNGYPKTELVRKSQDWHGTDRKCRGTIVQALRENESLTESAIKKLWPEESQVEKALKTLLEDQLIQALPRRRYRLPQ